MTEEIIMLTTTEAARVLGRKPSTLRSWRHRGIGPSWYQPVPGSAVIYKAEVIDDFKKQMED